ncbi:MAG: UDP-N-acetylmuramoyl-L-alanyl-D-glutamate--2,6-diaminopimelate ligase [Calditrichia bacterium]
MKRFNDILSGIPVLNTTGDMERLINEIQYDSRRVKAEDLFVAIRGLKTDGHHFLDELYRLGCRAFVVEEMANLPGASVARVADTREQLPNLARNFYERVDRNLKFIGITGTNGKTSCAYLLYSVLERARMKPGLISTIDYVVKDKNIPATHTTPESVDLYRLFDEMVRNNLKSVVMEVSSHALALHRTDGIPFSAAVFTNLAHDHLDFHGDMENYFQTKKKLFERLPETSQAIINIDDSYAVRNIDATDAEVFTYSMSDSRATVSLKSWHTVGYGMYLTLNIPGRTISFSSSLLGKFNIYNIMAATAAGLALGLTDDLIVDGVEAVNNIPGRAEHFHLPGGAHIFVDYAHSPDALRRILEALMEFHPGRIILVFGCGGDRDTEKRPLMGKIAEDYADLIFLTNDNPRSEEPLQIIEQIKRGIYDQSKVRVIPDREEAIITALQNAEHNDLLLIAGKGHETYQEFAGKRIHFDDREVIRHFLQPA